MSKLDLLQAAFFTPMPGGDWGLPLILWGEPGTTKTASLKALGRKFAMHVERLAPGARGEGAFGVTPVPVAGEHGMVLQYPPPDWAASLANGGILFVDEMNTLPPALQPAGLDAVQERTIGSLRLPKRVRVFGAANPVGHAAGGWDFSAAQANRLGHIDWPCPEVEVWANWLLGGASVEGEKPEDAEKVEAKVMKMWPEFFARASGIVSAFLRARPELLHKMPKDGDPKQSRSWPSTRTWEYTVRSLATSMVHNLTEVDRDELCTGFIGAGPVGELMDFQKEMDLPSPSDLLDGKVTFEHNPERLDRTVAVLNSCAALVTPKDAKQRNERGESLWKILTVVSEDAKDVIVPSMQALVQAQLKTASAKPLMAKMHSVVTSVGSLA